MQVSTNHARIGLLTGAAAIILAAAPASAATIDVPTSFYETGQLDCSLIDYANPQHNFINEKDHSTYDLWVTDPALAQSLFGRCDAAEHPQPVVADAPAVLADSTQLPTTLPVTGSSAPALAIASLLAAIGASVTFRRGLRR